MNTIHQVVSKALDYQSPGVEQATNVIQALKDHSMINVDQFTPAMLTALSNEIDKYHQLLPTGYVNGSLDALVVRLLSSWNVLGVLTDAPEATDV